MEVSRLPRRPGAPGRFFETTGDLPARRSAWETPRLAGDVHLAAFREQLGRVLPTPPVPEWELIATRIAQAAERAARGRQTIDEALGGARRRGGCDPREAPVDRGAARGERQGSERARARGRTGPRIAPGWWFVAPALVLIVVFFVGPVIAAVGLSFTDFDLYALADAGAARWVGLRNYARVLHEPLFWQALATPSTSPSSAVR